jgi:hypothetical protein
MRRKSKEPEFGKDENGNDTPLTIIRIGSPTPAASSKEFMTWIYEKLKQYGESPASDNMGRLQSIIDRL